MDSKSYISSNNKCKKEKLMKKILFIQKSGLPWFGVMHLSSYLKQHGHITSLTFEKEIRQTIDLLKPDFIGFPVITGEHGWVYSKVDEISQYWKGKFILGGPHTTFYDGLVRENVYNLIGEAEYSTLDIVEERDFVRTELCEQLDSLPWPDRSIYYRYNHLKDQTVKQFLTGRGCPYKCSFCSNALYSKLYPDQKWVRFRSTESIIDEITHVKHQYGLSKLSFTDDVFTLNTNRLSNFLDLYAKRINVPFMCNVRADIVVKNPEIPKMLKEAGCFAVSLGVESGNPENREKLLQKGPLTNDGFITASEIIRKCGLKLKTYSMIGLPNETLDQAMETVKLNSKMKPNHASCSFLTPYPRYEICKYYKKDEITLDSIPLSIYEPMKDVKKEIVALQTFFVLWTRFPILIFFMKWMLYIRVFHKFRILPQLIYGMSMAHVHGLGARDIVRYVTHINPFRV